MSTLLLDLLDSRQDRSESLQMDHQPEASTDLIAGALSVLAPLAKAKDIAIEQDLVDVRVDVDRNRIFQVLSNLIGNAIKFTPIGGAITIRAVRRGAEPQITVTDTGPGIPIDQRAHVFERYWRAEQRHGSGLGLYIAKGIVEAHGGRIWVEAAAGATFGFTVPVAGAESDRSALRGRYHRSM